MMGLAALPGGMSAPIFALAVVAAIIVLLALLAAWRVARAARTLHRAERAGRSVSAARSGASPVTSFSRDGAPSDPLNVRITGSSGQLAAAFTAAGWYRADEIDLVTSVRISFDSVLGRKYSSAPVSNLYLFGRKEDFAFERPGASVRERDHVRLWRAGARAPDGRAIWLGGATHDMKVEISRTTHLPTHKIAPAVDDERATVLDTLVESGWVTAEGWEPGFGKPTEERNSLGDSYFTDGRRAVITLANVPVVTPIVTQVRGPLALGIVRAVMAPLRWRLPRAARALARRHRAARLERERERAGVRG